MPKRHKYSRRVRLFVYTCSVLTLLLVVIGVAGTIAGSSSSSSHDNYLSTVNKASLFTPGTTDDNKVAAGETICANLKSGESGTQVINDVEGAAGTQDRATTLIAAAVVNFCPEEKTAATTN